MTEQTNIPETTPKAEELPPLEPPKLPYLMKADLKYYRNQLGIGRPILGLLISGLIWLRFGFVSWVIFVVAIAAVLAIVYIACSRRTILVDEQGIEYRNIFGITKRARFDEIKEALVLIGFQDFSFGPAPRTIIMKKDGTILLSLNVLYWDIDQFDLLTVALVDRKLEVKTSELPVDSFALAKEFPAYLPWYERHMILTGLIAALAIFVVVAAIAVFISFN